MSRISMIRTLGQAGFCLAVVGMAAVSVGCAPDNEELRQAAIQRYRSQQYVESMATLREVLERDRADAKANYYMGLNHRAIAERKFRQGDVTAACRELDTAVLYFTQAVKSWPNYIAAVEAQNRALELRGRYDEALDLAERVAHNNRGVAEHFIILGNEYRERADYDNALRCYKIALATDPESAKVHAALGRLYEQTGDRALAMDAYRRAAELDPRNRDAQQRLGRLGSDRRARTADHAPLSSP